MSRANKKREERKRAALEIAHKRGRPLSQKEIDDLYAKGQGGSQQGQTPLERRIQRRTVTPGARR